MIPLGPETPNLNDAQTFDVDAARQERLRWKVGQEPPTERAMGIQEGFAREYAADVQAMQDKFANEAEARQQFLKSRLGGAALDETVNPEADGEESDS